MTEESESVEAMKYEKLLVVALASLLVSWVSKQSCTPKHQVKFEPFVAFDEETVIQTLDDAERFLNSFHGPLWTTFEPLFDPINPNFMWWKQNASLREATFRLKQLEKVSDITITETEKRLLEAEKDKDINHYRYFVAVTQLATKKYLETKRPTNLLAFYLINNYLATYEKLPPDLTGQTCESFDYVYNLFNETTNIEPRCDST